MITTIGLEVHVQLNSKTKIFCSCSTQFGALANSQVCPVCLGLPGSLPVLNRRVFDLGIRASLALGASISKKVKFDRKNYFYPDLPKGYQISQYDCPIGRDGLIELASGKKIRIHRAHLEEDAGKQLHDQSPTSTFVDLNRAGTPLLEIVSEPDLNTSDEAYEYLTYLKSVMKAVGVSDCNMEMGQLRCDANVSIRREASEPLGKKVEVKNLNSFKAVKAAIDYEVDRQTKCLEKKEEIFQETRLWDDTRAKTFSMRSKEEAHDYRYFPEPDLLPFNVTDAQIQEARQALPELPAQKKIRYQNEFGLSAYDAHLIADQMDIALFFEAAQKNYSNPKTLANWVMGPLFAYLSQNRVDLSETKITAQLLCQLITLVHSGRLSFQAAKDKVFPEMAASGGKPDEIMKEKGLLQVSDEGALNGWIGEVIGANSNVVQEYLAGKETVVMFLVGQVMKKSQGKANPGKVQELMKQALSRLK